MKKPKSISARGFVGGLPYEGEYFQPDDRIYLKLSMDRYIEYLETKVQHNQVLDHDGKKPPQA